MSGLIELTKQDKECPVQITRPAVAELRRLLHKQDDPEMCVRLGVRGGGCAGLNYDMRLDKPRTEKDRVWEIEDIKVVIDRKSLLFLTGTSLDFSNDLLSGGFHFNNPNATRSCGCGTSFSVG